MFSANIQTISAEVLEALARTNYTTLVSVYDDVDVEKMRTYVGRTAEETCKR